MSRTAARIRIFLPAFCLLAAGCQTVQKDLTVERLPEDSFHSLEAYEEELVALEAEPSREALASLRSRLAQAENQSVMERSWTARLAALSGRAALLAGDRAAAERELKVARSLHSGDEVACVLASRLEKNPDKSLALLDAAIDTADGQTRIQAERGHILLALSRYADALAAFDASLPLLPDAYGKAFGAERNKALALLGTRTSAPTSALYLTDRPLTLQGMAVLTQAESPLVDFLTGGKTWAAGVLFERLRSAGYYADATLSPAATVRRGDAAYFLWRLVANKKNDKTLLRKYSDRYGSRPYASSPVPDVSLASPWFDAVLGCVEREIMELPDGRLFHPDDTVSGLEFYGWLKKAADL